MQRDIKQYFMKKLTIRKFSFTFLACCIVFNARATENQAWSEAELELLRLNWLGSMPELSSDPTNKYADNPAAAKFGQQLFFDQRLSANGKVACATCHMPDKLFTDGLAKSRGVG